MMNFHIVSSFYLSILFMSFFCFIFYLLLLSSSISFSNAQIFERSSDLLKDLNQRTHIIDIDIQQNEEKEISLKSSNDAKKFGINKFTITEYPKHYEKIDLVDDNKNGKVVYIPETDFVGDDSFKYKIAYGGSSSSIDDATPQQYENGIVRIHINDNPTLLPPPPADDITAIAKATPDKVQSGEKVTLDGSDSIAPYGLDYTWKEISQLDVKIQDPNKEKTYFIAPDVKQKKENLIIEMKASFTRDTAVQDSDHVTITVNPKQEGEEPESLNAVAKASPEFVYSGKKVTLDASDSVGNIQEYEWVMDLNSKDYKKIIDIKNSKEKIAHFFAPDVDEKIFLNFELRVSDTKENKDTDKVKVEINPQEIKGENNPPIANAGSAQLHNVGEIVTLDGTKSYDEDGDSLTYEWNVIYPTIKDIEDVIKIRDKYIENPSFVIPANFEDSKIKFELVVNDGIEYSEPSEVEVNIETNSFGSKDTEQTYVPSSLFSSLFPPPIPQGIAGWIVIAAIGGGPVIAILAIIVSKMQKGGKKGDNIINVKVTTRGGLE